MTALERYQIDRTSDRVTITLNQKRNALANMLIGLVLMAVATYLWLTSGQSSALPLVLMGIGALWLAVAFAGYRQRRSHVLNRDRLEYHSSGRSEPAVQPASELSRVLVQKMLRPAGVRKRKPRFRWRVSLIGNDGAAFKGTFRLQREENARALASLIADFYGVDTLEDEV